jgi:hypothetical protein
MPATAARRARWGRAFRARPWELHQRSFAPSGLTMRGCQACGSAHPATSPTDPVRCPELAEEFEQFLNDTFEGRPPMLQVFGRPGRLTVDSLRMRFAAVSDQLQAAASMQERAQEALVSLREDAKASGLSSELRALEQPPVVAVPDRSEPMVRCRVLEGYSTTYTNMPFAAATDDVVDLPRGLAHGLMRVGLVEEVGPETSLRRREVRWR